MISLEDIKELKTTVVGILGTVAALIAWLSGWLEDPEGFMALVAILQGMGLVKAHDPKKRGGAA